MACQLPCIDISPWLDSSAPQSSRQEVVSQVGNACENVGFFAVTNLPKKLRRAIEKASQEAGKLFRHLEKNPKLKAKLHDIQRAGVESEGEGRPRAYGYFPMKSEALGYDADVTKKPDLREAFSMGPSVSAPRFRACLDEKKGGSNVTSDFSRKIKHHYTMADVIKFFFQETPWPLLEGIDFRSAMTEFYDLTSELGTILLNIMALALKIDPGRLQEASQTGNHANSARAILYPKLKKEALSGQLRCGAHSDTGALTLLWSDTPGLELKPRTERGGEAEWVPVANMESKGSSASLFGNTNTLIVNIGELLSRLSKGTWASTPHRVPAPALDAPENRPRIVLVNFIMLAPDFQIDDTGLTQGEYAFNHFLRWGRNAKTDPTPTCEKCSLACNVI
ncbi:hypothetical protein AAMO2058_000114500 [Amorphochlora amoebiformis]